ncbi:MAG: cupredoxin domain-containing protein [Bacteriovoracaceae bacterium]
MKKTIGLFLFAFYPICLLAEESEAFKAKTFEKPVREFSVIATDAGYFPNRIFAYVGEKARFFVTSTDDSPQCFLLEDHNVFLAAKKGKMEEAQVEFKYPGRFEYHCPSTKFKGHVTVVAKPGIKKSARTREVASEKKDYWTPKDNDLKSYD